MIPTLKYRDETQGTEFLRTAPHKLTTMSGVHAPELPIGRILKSKSLGGKRLISVVSLKENQENGMLRVIVCTLVGIIVVATASLAEDPLKVGMIAPTSIVAEFVTGEWAERGSSCPVLANREAMKVAVFVKQLNDPVLPLVNAIEEIVASDSSLKWSFVFVSHENAPTPSQAEWDSQLARLRKLAGDMKMEHLSLGVLIRNPDTGSPSKAKRQLGFFGDGDVVVMLIRPDANAKRGVIQYLSVLKSEEIQEKAIERIGSQLKEAIVKAKPKG